MRRVVGRFGRVQWLNEVSAGRDNNFNLIRFAAASLVIFSHSYALTASGPDLIERWTGLNAGLIAVYAFFVVSGFLVTQSYLSRGRALPFLEARALRVFPALLVMLVVTVLLLGPLVSSLPLADYVEHDVVHTYLWKNAILILGVDYFIPGAFDDNKYPAFFNGSLWTLPAEVRFYLVIGLLGILGLLRSVPVFNIVCAALLVIFMWMPDWMFVLDGHKWYPRVGWYFMLGALLRVNRHYVPMSGWLAAGLIALTALLRESVMFPALLSISVAYGVLWFSFIPKGVIHGFNSIGDFSYGLYIYAFPLQQAVVWWQREVTMPVHFAISYVLTLSLAVSSWYLIERRALRLKGRTGISWLDSRWQGRRNGKE